MFGDELSWSFLDYFQTGVAKSKGLVILERSHWGCQLALPSCFQSFSVDGPVPHSKSETVKSHYFPHKIH